MSDFLKLLLPWQETSNDQIISDVFVSGILLFFFICFGIFLAKTIRRGMFINKLTVEISRFAEDVGRNNRPAEPQILHELKEKFPTKGELAEAWREFEDSLITDENRVIVYKTDEASLFFSEERLLEQYIYLRFWNSVPAILVGLGILGTFVGLVLGLRDFSDIKFEQSNEIQNAITNLLSGVSTAFVTSVWGMVVSLLFNVLEKWRISRVSRAITKLQRALNQLFSLITQEAISVQNKDLLEQLTAAFKSSATDLADAIAEKLTPSINRVESAIGGIKEGQDNLVIEIQKAPDAFSQAVAKELQPSLDELNASLDELNETVKELRKEKDESSTEAIRELVEEFKNALSRSFTKEIETLVKELSTVSQSLIDLPTRMENMMKGVQEKIDKICESLKSATDSQTKLTEKTINEILGELRSTITELKNAIDSTTSKAATESSEMIRQIRESVKTTADRLNNIFVEGETRVSTLLEKQGELIDAVNSPISKSQEALDKGNDLLDKMNTSLNNANEMIVTMQAFSDQLKGAASTLKTAGDDLTKASTDFNKQNKEYLDKNRETNQNIQGSLKQSQELLDKFAEKFNTIESELQSIFSEIEKGLNTYAVSSRETINTYLIAFSTQLTAAVAALSNSIEALEDNFEDLNDRIEKLLRR